MSDDYWILGPIEWLETRFDPYLWGGGHVISCAAARCTPGREGRRSAWSPDAAMRTGDPSELRSLPPEYRGWNGAFTQTETETGRITGGSGISQTRAPIGMKTYCLENFGWKMHENIRNATERGLAWVPNAESPLLHSPMHGIIASASWCTMNTSTQFFTSYFSSVSLSDSVSLNVNISIL